jgi:hypothetical protein
MIWDGSTSAIDFRTEAAVVTDLGTAVVRILFMLDRGLSDSRLRTIGLRTVSRMQAAVRLFGDCDPCQLEGLFDFDTDLDGFLLATLGQIGSQKFTHQPARGAWNVEKLNSPAAIPVLPDELA